MADGDDVQVSAVQRHHLEGQVYALEVLLHNVVMRLEAQAMVEALLRRDVIEAMVGGLPEPERTSRKEGIVHALCLVAGEHPPGDRAEFARRFGH